MPPACASWRSRWALFKTFLLSNGLYGSASQVLIEPYITALSQQPVEVLTHTLSLVGQRLRPTGVIMEWSWSNDHEVMEWSDGVIGQFMTIHDLDEVNCGRPSIDVIGFAETPAGGNWNAFHQSSDIETQVMNQMRTWSKRVCTLWLSDSLTWIQVEKNYSPPPTCL